MVFGIVVLGWLVGLGAAGVYLATAASSWLVALLVFIGAGNLTVLGLASVAFLRGERATRRDDTPTPSPQAAAFVRGNAGTRAA
jgi:hypothetical protein